MISVNPSAGPKATSGGRSEPPCRLIVASEVDAGQLPTQTIAPSWMRTSNGAEMSSPSSVRPALPLRRRRTSETLVKTMSFRVVLATGVDHSRSSSSKSSRRVMGESGTDAMGGLFDDLGSSFA